MSCIYDYNPKDDNLPGLNNPQLVVDGDIIVGGVTKVVLSLTETLADVTAELPAGITVNVESENGDIVPGLLVDDMRNVFEADTRELDMNGKMKVRKSIYGGAITAV